MSPIRNASSSQRSPSSSRLRSFTGSYDQFFRLRLSAQPYHPYRRQESIAAQEERDAEAALAAHDLPPSAMRELRDEYKMFATLEMPVTFNCLLKHTVAYEM